MGVMMSSDIITAAYNNSKTQARATELTTKLTSGAEGTDEELMDACKSFESYLLEQVMKSAEKTIMKADDEENEYLSMFKDNMFQEYARMITESGQIGLAKQLYESMKR